MKEAHGENIPQVKVSLDPQVMYKCTGRKPHGKFAIADGAIDSSQVQFSPNVRPSPSQSSSNQRERKLEQEVRDLKRSFCNAFIIGIDDSLLIKPQGPLMGLMTHTPTFTKFNEDLTQVIVPSISLIHGCIDCMNYLLCACIITNYYNIYQFMRQGCPDAPPPQIDLASLFQNPVTLTSEPVII